MKNKALSNPEFFERNKGNRTSNQKVDSQSFARSCGSCLDTTKKYRFWNGSQKKDRTFLLVNACQQACEFRL